jgi:hypothetical protein
MNEMTQFEEASIAVADDGRYVYCIIKSPDPRISGP